MSTRNSAEAGTGSRRSDPIHLCFLSDDSYLPHMTVSAASAVAHASRPLIIDLVHPGLSPESLERLDQFAKMYPAMTLRLIQCEPSRFQDYPGIGKWPPLLYAKLLLPELLAEDRVLMLDCDVVVMDDLAKIYDLPFPPGISLAACNNLFTRRRVREMGLFPESTEEYYFNAGVLLFDLKALREEHFLPRVLEVPPEVLSKIRFQEQDLMNLYFRDRYLVLDSRWNLFSTLTRRRIRSRFPEKKEMLFAALKSPGIIHYISRKPWKCALPETPYDRYYRFYLKRTPFADYRFPPVTWRDLLAFILPQALAKYLKK